MRVQPVSSPRKTCTASPRSFPSALSRVCSSAASDRYVSVPRMATTAEVRALAKVALEGLEHVGHERAGERFGQAVEGLRLAVEERRGVGTEVVFVLEHEPLVGPDRLVDAGLGVLHLGRDRDLVARGLAGGG